MRFPLVVVAATAFLDLGFSACAQIPGTASDDVPPTIAAQARRLAERTPQLRASLAGPRTVFIGVELVRIKDARGREAEPLYRVQHYRYPDDTVIDSLVDVRSGGVRSIEERAHAPVALSVEELGEARALALTNPRVSRSLSRFGDRIVVEPLVVRTSDPADPWFGRRIVRLLFRVGADYVADPVVFVDLTRREVIVQPPHGDQQ